MADEHRGDMLCAACAFFSPFPPAPGADPNTPIQGECRRSPPVLVSYGGMDHAHDSYSMTQFPDVAEDKWCGEWRAR